MTNRLLLWTSVLVGLQILTAGTALTDVIGPKIAGLAVLIVAAAQGATVAYTKGSSVPASEAVPNAQVIARQPHPSSPVMATTAAESAYGIPAGSVVDVNPTTTPPGTGPGVAT